ncbi:hypothetical protein PMKS-003917 [Pichia membranifaciens]|uniref:Uncharacterized protein n=1 Tax=Pichia membranifaciens TaxID=4926 RepID=A0A1Q2YLH1_9ASCO|nr:hypothetical protein PMKS-003917 [Pichia membranifaciens]
MAPKMSGEFVKPVVYMSKPSNRGAGEDDVLDKDTRQVHEAEGPAELWQSLWGRKDEDQEGDDEGQGEVDQTVGEPRQHVEEGVCFRGQDLGQVVAKEDGFQDGQDLHGDGSLHREGDELGDEEQEDPCQDGQAVCEELREDRRKVDVDEHENDDELCQQWHPHDGDGEGEHRQEEREVEDCRPVGILQVFRQVSEVGDRVERGLQRRQLVSAGLGCLKGGDELSYQGR